MPTRRIKSINVLHNLFFAACEIQFRTGGQRSCWADKYPISGLDAILTYYYSFVLVHCQDIIESSFWLDDTNFLTKSIDVGLDTILVATLFCVCIRHSQLLLTIGWASLFCAQCQDIIESNSRLEYSS